MNHKELDVWTRSVDFVTLIYKETTSFPEQEKFGLINQIRRASVSIPSNIARNSDKEFIRFLYISLGSASEVETQLIISKNLGFTTEAELHLKKLNEIQKLIKGLINYLNKKITIKGFFLFTVHDSLT